jgi:hypothetical protein
LKSIELAPDEHFAKWLNLGQVVGGLDGLKYTTKGIELMKVERDKYKPEEVKPCLKFKIIIRVNIQT